MGLYASLQSFISRFRTRHARSYQLPDGAHASATRLPTDGDDPPEWLRIVPLGEFPEHHDGAHEVTDDHLGEMVANFERRSTDILVDFDHAAVFEGDTRAAAWISDVEVRDDGLYGRISDWTPAGEEAFSNRDFRYLSPVYFLESEDKQGNEAGAYLHSVAITNLPYFDEGEIDPIGNQAPPADPQDEDSPPTEDPSDFMERDELIEKLGLDEDASQEEINEALSEAANGRADEDEEGEPPEEEGDDGSGNEPEEASGEDGDSEPEDLEAKVNRLQQRLDERERQEEEDRAEALVSGAVEAGKILPAQKRVWVNSAKADYDGTKEQIDDLDEGAAAPRGVKTSRTPAGSGGAAKRSSSLKTSTDDYLDECGL
jgi:phage I-like protein